MKKSLLFFFVFICGLAFGQQNISELTSTSKEATAALEYIYDLDVFSYFNLKDYDTELQKSVFLKTEEGQNKLNELKSIKTEMLKTTYYVKGSDYFKDNYPFTKVNYDIEKKGFNINLGWIVTKKIRTPRTPKSIAFDETEKSRILLKALPSKKVKVPGSLEQYAEELFIPMSEESGLEVENDKENTDVYFFFTPNGREKTVVKVWDWDENQTKTYEFLLRNPQYIKYKLYSITNDDLKADKVRIVVANSLSGKILYDKSFSYQAQPTK
jgi:hypothetical protein